MMEATTVWGENDIGRSKGLMVMKNNLCTVLYPLRSFDCTGRLDLHVSFRFHGMVSPGSPLIRCDAMAMLDQIITSMRRPIICAVPS